MVDDSWEEPDLGALHDSDDDETDVAGLSRADAAQVKLISREKRALYAAYLKAFALHCFNSYNDSVGQRPNDKVFIGPYRGAPTYTVCQWRVTAVLRPCSGVHGFSCR